MYLWFRDYSDRGISRKIDPPLKSSQAFGVGLNLTKGFFTFRPG